MKLLGVMMILTATLLAFFFGEKQRLRKAGRVTDALSLLAFLENGIGYLASPVGELLEEFQKLHQDNSLLLPEICGSAPGDRLKEDTDEVYRQLRNLFYALGNAGGETAIKEIGYYRKLLLEEEENCRKDLTLSYRVRLPLYLSLALLLTILIY